MSANESWIYQGRQQHGWFGHGTGPGQDAEGTQEHDLFRPENAADRVDYVAYGLIGHIPRQDRGRWNGAWSDSARSDLKTAVAAWFGSQKLSRSAFRERFLDPTTSDDTVDRLREAAVRMLEGKSYDDLARAGDDLAAAALTIGPDRWPRFLGAASRRAVAAVDHGEVPGVGKASAADTATGGLLLGLLVLLGVMLGPKTIGDAASPSPAARGGE